MGHHAMTIIPIKKKGEKRRKEIKKPGLG